MTTNNRTVIHALREATAARHQAIEALLSLDGSALTLHRYVRVLQGLELFLTHWEPRINAALPPPMGRWFAHRSRRLFAQRDLAMLGAPGRRGEGDPLRDLQVGSMAAAFGSMYVMEGSALGGQVIAARVRQVLGMERDRGAAYFTGWGEQTPAMWREFRTRLEEQVDAASGACDEACAAAVQTFESLIRAFCMVMHDPVHPHSNTMPLKMSRGDAASVARALELAVRA